MFKRFSYIGQFQDSVCGSVIAEISTNFIQNVYSCVGLCRVIPNLFTVPFFHTQFHFFLPLLIQNKEKKKTMQE